MARIRSVHPDICRDETLAEISASAERTFVRLWCHLDDAGRAIDNPRLIKSDLYPLHDEMTAAKVDDDLAELTEAGLIIRYEVNGKRYLSAKPEAWAQFQRPRHPKPSELPAPSDVTQVIGTEPEHATALRPQHSEVTGETGAECRNVTAERGETFHGVGEGVGVGDGEGVNPSVDEASPTSTGLALVPTANVEPETRPPDQLSKADQTQLVFDTWRKATGKPKAKLDPKRRKRISEALKSYPVEDLLDAVQGWRYSPHHRGENDRGTVYNELELLLRDAARIEQFRDLNRNGPQPRARAEPASADMIRRLAAGEL